MRLANFLRVVILVFVASAGFGASLAQSYPPAEEWEKRQNIDERLRSYGPDILGDQIDPHMGSITFEHTDISLPGNFALPVAVSRRRSQGFRYFETVNVEFGDWEFTAPRISVVAPDITWTGNRCTNSYLTSFPNIMPPGGQGPWGVNPPAIDRLQYSNGVLLEVPGQGAQQILEAPRGAPWPVAAKYVTADHWWFECTTATDGGQGFIGHAPNGDVYTFNKFIMLRGENLGSVNSGKDQGIQRQVKMLAATLVTDKSGNTVNYNYEAGGNRLTSITSSDGRAIDLFYDNATFPALVTRAVANGRTWTYSYRPNSQLSFDFEPAPHVFKNQVLASVQQPDGRSWIFNLDVMSSSPAPGQDCTTSTDTISLTHPYGMTGTFTLAELDHRQGLNWVMPYVLVCPEPDGGGGVSAQPVFVLGRSSIMSVTDKTISGPGVPTATWTYQYEDDRGAPGSNTGSPAYTNWTIVTEPGGSQIKYFHNWTQPVSQNGVLLYAGGKLVRKEAWQSASAGPLEVDDYTIDKDGAPIYGLPLAPAPNNMSPMPVQIAKITRGSEWHQTANTFNWSTGAFGWGFPTQVTETSSTTPDTRTGVTAYAHNLTNWVLGLPASVTRNGKLLDSYTYDANGRIATKSQFGTIRETYTYHTAVGQKGAVSTLTDSHSLAHQWTLSNWKRGQPQTTLRPDGNTLSRVVNDNGWVVSETDWRGITTGFSYNNMGWLTGVDRPAPFNDLTVSYSGLGAGVVEARTLGAKKTTITYDGMMRPTQVRTEATDASAATNFVETGYDIFGRATYQSWPSATAGSLAGVNTTYDALSRPLTVAETVTPFATTTTAYLAGGVTRVTDPSGAIVTTTARAFGDPDSAEPMSIVDAMGATTTMTRDIYGNVTTLSQSGTQNGFTASVTRNFWYDSNLRLCRHRAPEFGDEVFLYDSEGLLTQSGRGQAAASGCVTSIGTGIRVTHAYDAVHRETSLSFPAGTPGVARSYDANGNLTNVTRTGGAVWDYTYTALDAIATETLAIDGRAYAFGYGYTPNGDLTTRSNSHSGVTVDFSANAFGQPRRARVGATDYISGAVYHENGLPESAAYLNGQLFTQTLTARQLPDQLKTARPGGATAVWQTYGYDVRRKVNSVIDGVSAAENRSYTYDANGRLLTASGPWGAGSYLYDALGNIRSRSEGSGSISTLNYDASNRVSSATILGSARTFAYVANDPVNKTDPTGEYIESAIDIAFLVADVAAIADSGFTAGNIAAVIGDVAGLAAPGATGGGLVARAAVEGVQAGLKAADKAGDAAKAVAKTCCFVAGTLVETAEGLKPIEKIAVGDLVLARNVETGETALKAVTDLIRRHERTIWQVSLNGLDGDSASFKTTDDHPWWIAGQGWKKTAELAAGMAVVTKNGRGMVVASVTETDRTDATFNLTVADFETYFVGKNGVLVHNCPTGGGRGANNLKPDPKAEGPHSTFKRGEDGKVSGHAEFQPNDKNPSGFDQTKRVDVTGKPHTNRDGTSVPTPHVHEKGTKDVRPARPDEIPD